MIFCIVLCCVRNCHLVTVNAYDLSLSRCSKYSRHVDLTDDKRLDCTHTSYLTGFNLVTTEGFSDEPLNAIINFFTKYSYFTMLC